MFKNDNMDFILPQKWKYLVKIFDIKLFFSKDGKFSFDLIKQIESFPSSKFFKNYKDKFEKPEDTSKYWIKEQEKINSLNKIFFFKTHNALCKINGNKFTDTNNTLAAIYIVEILVI